MYGPPPSHSHMRYSRASPDDRTTLGSHHRSSNKLVSRPNVPYLTETRRVGYLMHDVKTIFSNTGRGASSKYRSMTCCRFQIHSKLSIPELSGVIKFISVLLSDSVLACLNRVLS